MLPMRGDIPELQVFILAREAGKPSAVARQRSLLQKDEIADPQGFT